jgi:large subunit ribosomal protein L13
MQIATKPTKAEQIKRNWHLRDAKGKILGRFSSEIATLLMGKQKAYFVRNLDCGDYVVVVNAKEIAVTGKKEIDKYYARHSGYPGGFKSETLKEMRDRDPEEIIRHAVFGMIPHNKIGAKLMKRLYVFEGEEHEYHDKFKVKS